MTRREKWELVRRLERENKRSMNEVARKRVRIRQLMVEIRAEPREDEVSGLPAAV